MLKSKDPEMRSLAVIVFCQQKPSFIEFKHIEQVFKWGDFYDDPHVSHYLRRMLKCIR